MGRDKEVENMIIIAGLGNPTKEYEGTRHNVGFQVIDKIAEKYNKTTAQLLLRWNIQQGIIPIPKSKNEQRLQQNIDVFDFEITKEDMEELNHMNENHRTSFDPLTFDF